MRSAAPALLALVVLSGCMAEVREFQAFEPDTFYDNPGVFPGKYSNSGGSRVLQPGPYHAAEVEVFRLPSRVDGASIPIALWRPIVPVGVQVPVIVDAGPYYEQGNSTIERPDQTTPFLLRNFLPQGYAVAQVAVRGTGTAGGCMELFGPNEVSDLDQAVTWLGERAWSNGHVAMIGASYDGSTPWMVASTGNRYLKTIVPVSGLPSLWDLLVHEGTAEGRAGAIHNLYWGYGVGKDFPVWEVRNRTDPQFDPGWTANGRSHQDSLRNLLCPDAWQGILRGNVGLATSEGGEDEFWRVRDFRDRVLDNYKGSVFLVHGLQDWNVDPHVVFPFNHQMRERGIPLKEWHGQWGHAFPDSFCARSTPTWFWQPCRLDYAEVLAHWFDRWLYGNETADLGPMVQTQDNRGRWRNVEAFQPQDTAWLELRPGADGRLSDAPQTGTVRLRATGTPGEGTVRAEYRSDPLPADVHISGRPELLLEMVGQGSEGLVSAWLLDEDPDGDVVTLAGWDPDAREVIYFDHGLLPRIVGHGQLSLRHAAAQAGAAPAPGVPVEGRLLFEPLEVHVPAGHRITLWLQQDPYPDHVVPVTGAPVTVALGGDSGATLRLPVSDVDVRDVFPVPGSHFPLRDHFLRFHQDKPPMPATPAPAEVPLAPGLLGLG